MKNVTGYDLVKLMAGSYGTLGVLTEVSFKVLPAPEIVASLSLDGLGAADAVAAMSTALGAPFEVTGAARLPSGKVRLRIEGFAASVAERAEKLRARLSGFGAVEVETGAEVVQAQWQAIRDVTVFAGQPGAVWRISVTPGDAPAVMAALPGAEIQLDWGGGLIWARLEEHVDLRAALAGIPGPCHAAAGQPGAARGGRCLSAAGPGCRRALGRVAGPVRPAQHPQPGADVMKLDCQMSRCPECGAEAAFRIAREYALCRKCGWEGDGTCLLAEGDGGDAASWGPPPDIGSTG